MRLKPQLLRGAALGAVVLGMATPHAQAQTADKKTAISGWVSSLQYTGNLGSDFWKRSSVDIEVGGGGGITRYLSPSFDLGVYGNYETYKFSSNTKPGENFEARVGMIDLGLKLKMNNGKILKEDFFLQPYLMAGPGLFITNSKGRSTSLGQAGPTDFFRQIRRGEVFGAGGLRFRISPSVFADVQLGYLKGLAALQGCPDRDGDGVTDAEDACPDTPGKAELRGCPDSDNDGVIDQNDKCPGTPAGVRVDANGCPLDRDGDGVPDYQDRCPDRPGPASNKGCPEIKAEAKKRLQEATKFINFQFNKAVLLPSSYPTLKDLAALMSEYPDYTMSIAGHTDSKGADDYNLRLSYDRAASARTYMLSQGVPADRIESRGYGETKPIADNANATGQALNRRVEFDLYLTGEPNSAEVKYGPAPTISELQKTPEGRPTAGKAPVKKAPAKKAPVRKAPAKRK